MPADLAAAASPLADASARPIGSADPARDAYPPPSGPLDPPMQASTLPWATALAIIYAVVAAFLTTRLCTGLVLAARIARRAAVVDVGSPVGRATVHESPAVRTPMMFGVLRPRILLPMDWRSWSDDKLAAVLAHESAHARRGDWLAVVLADLDRAVFWFHPLAWILKRVVEETAERCCDDAVLSEGVARTRYARHLLDFAAVAARNQRPLALSITRPPLLERRIDAILDDERPLARRLSVGAATLLASGALASSLLAASLTPQAPRPQDPRSPAQTSDAATLAYVTHALTPGVTREGAPALRIRVLDATDDTPIWSFLAVLGGRIRDDMVDPAFVGRFGREQIVNWQPHTVRQGVDGELHWPLARIYDECAVRVEAPGFVPQVYRWLDKEAGPQTLVFRLARDPQPRSVVVAADGTPAAGAEIGIAITNRAPRIDGSRLGYGDPEPTDLRERWSRGPLARADAAGIFRVRAESERSAFVVAVHESGTCVVPIEEFEWSRRLVLEPWGAVRGVVRGTEALAGEKVLLQDRPPDGEIYPARPTYHFAVETDDTGSFAMERFPPGAGQAWLTEYIPDRHLEQLPWGFPPTPEGATRTFDVRSGQTTRIELGGPRLGRKRESAGGR